MIIIYILAIFGLAFAIKEIDGPWDICSKTRNALMRNKYVGVFFYKLLSCYFCVGFHCGWIVYLLQADHYKFQFIILWGLAGSAASLILDTALTKFSSQAN